MKIILWLAVGIVIGTQFVILTNAKNEPRIIKVAEAVQCTKEEVKTPQNAPQDATEWDGEARITAYSELDSCHYPDGKGGCLNAYNKTIKIGEIACLRKYPKGTKIEIEGLGKYVCMDKTANWVQENLGMTFDIWIGYGQESHNKAIKFGSKQLNYKVI